MPIEAAEIFIPKGDDMREAFAVASRKHKLKDEPIENLLKKPWNRLALALGDYFTAGVAYLANRGHDEHIRKIGTDTWSAIQKRQIIPSLVKDMRIAAMQLGVAADIANTTYSRNDEPHIVFTDEHQDYRIFILMPPHFLIQAHQQPIEALGNITYLSSYIQYFKQERGAEDLGQIHLRALLTNAHLLLEAKRRYPELKFSPKSEQLLLHFSEE